MDSNNLKHARVLVEYCLHLGPGEHVEIAGSAATLPLMREAYSEAVKAGAYPQITLRDDSFEERLLKFGDDEQIGYVPSSDLETIKSIDALLFIWGSENTRQLSAIQADRSGKRARAWGEWSRIYSSRVSSGRLRWCGTLYPSSAEAQQASMSLDDYREFVYGACYLDCADPVARWQEIHCEQQRYVDFLDGVHELRIVAKDTDITIGCGGRKWQNSDGRENFPSGEVFTSPIEDRVNGRIRFSYPGIFMGKEIEDIRLVFKDGVVVNAAASRGEELLRELLKIEGADRVGEVAMGTNYNIRKFTKNMLFDEKIGGTVHLALGQGFQQAGGQNVSDIHWDMLCDMKEGGKIYADGNLIYREGKFEI